MSSYFRLGQVMPSYVWIVQEIHEKFGNARLFQVKSG